jgi:hypothetical protein
MITDILGSAVLAARKGLGALVRMGLAAPLPGMKDAIVVANFD